MPTERIRRRGDRRPPVIAMLGLLGILAAPLAGCQSVGGVAGALPAATEAESGMSDMAIPVPGQDRPMSARLHLPAGTGPFPLAIVNHGSDQRLEARALMPMPAYPALTDFLLGEGYAVLIPLRPGHGSAGGRYLEDQGGCERADYRQAGLATAALIRAAIDHMHAMPMIRPGETLVIGTSAGGWGAVALASLNPQGVVGYVNFSGGRGGRNRGKPGENCAPERLVAAAAAFGHDARLPGLWLYAANDSYFPPHLSAALAQAYRDAGGRVTFDLRPAVPGDGHGLIQQPAAQWEAPLRRFLRDASPGRR